MAIYSLLNSFEFFQRGEERHRQATIILMDLAVEYILKAKLYEASPVDFLEGQARAIDRFSSFFTKFIFSVSVIVLTKKL